MESRRKKNFSEASAVHKGEFRNFFNVGVAEVNTLKQSFFFHEYGRRVGMVPRSSLKGGKSSLMVEKSTRTPNTTQTKQPKAHRPSLHHHVVFPLC